MAGGRTGRRRANPARFRAASARSTGWSASARRLGKDHARPVQVVGAGGDQPDDLLRGEVGLGQRLGWIGRVSRASPRSCRCNKSSAAPEL